MTRTSIVSVATLAAIMIASPVSAQRPTAPGPAAPATPPAALKAVPAASSDDALAKNFQAEHEIGRRFHFDPADLPMPKTGPVVTDRSLIVPYSGQTRDIVRQRSGQSPSFAGA